MILIYSDFTIKERFRLEKTLIVSYILFFDRNWGILHDLLLLFHSLYFSFTPE